MLNLTTAVRSTYSINADTTICNSSSGCDTTYDGNTVLNSFHPGGTNSLFTDGSVHFLPQTILFDTLARLATKDDGQVIGAF